MKGQALKPNFLTESLTAIQVKQNGSEASDDERHLYALSHHAGWKVLKEFIDNNLAELDNKNLEAIESGMTFEQLGYNSVVLAQVKTIINRIKTRVQDAVEAIDKPDGTQK